MTGPGPLGSGIGGVGRAGGALGGRARLPGDRAGDESGAVPFEGKDGGTGGIPVAPGRVDGVRRRQTTSRSASPGGSADDGRTRSGSSRAERRASTVGQPEEKEPPSPDPPSKEEKLCAVAVGWEPGVHASWEEAKAQTEGCPNATHQSFSPRKEADRFVERWQPETREPTRATEGVSPRKWYTVAR